MTSGPASRRPRFRLSEETPRPRALAFAALWFGVAVAATVGEMLVAVHLSSVAWRVVIVVALILISTTSLMLASDDVEACLTGRLSGWGARLQWFTTSVVLLTVVVVLGAAAGLLSPDQPGASTLFMDLGIDLVLGVVSAAVAVLLILIAAEGLGKAIWWFQSRLGRTERWQAPAFSWGRLGRQYGRAVALTLAGLLLSVIFTALITSGTWLSAVGPLLLWFAGTGAVWWLLSRWRNHEIQSHRRVIHGTHASALAICLVIVAAFLTAASLESRARDRLWSGRTGPVPVVPITDQQASLDSPYLAQRFEPQLWLANGESWHPTEVTWYVQNDPKPNVDPPFCNTKNGCREISKACDTPTPGACAPSGVNDPALYYRYVNSSNANPLDHRPAAPPGSWTLIQYWVFYNYDSLDTASITQWHQSDWEQVSVLVMRRGNAVRPVAVAFSEHCYGAILPASRVRWFGYSHPVAYVGLGSHAHYPRRISVPVRQLRCSLALTPRYFGVAGLFFSPAVDGSRLEIPVAYVSGLRDHTSRIQPLPLPKLVPMGSVPAISSFKGAWGLDNNLRLFGLWTQATSAGPPAPPTQGPWTHPFLKMLCNNHWLEAPGVPRWVCG